MAKRNPIAIVSDCGITCVSNLDPREERFCIEMVVDGDPVAAAIRAGYSCDGSIGKKLMRRPTVKSRVRYHQAQRMARTAVTADRVVNELARIAFHDLRKVLTWDAEGNVRVMPSEEIDDNTAMAIAGIKQKRTVVSGARGDVTETITLEVDMSSKHAALTQMCKVMAIDKQTLEIKGTVEHKHSVEKGVTAEAAASIRENLWGSAVIDVEAKELPAAVGGEGE